MASLSNIEITALCPHCKKGVEFTASEDSRISCPECQVEFVGSERTPISSLDPCLVCGGAHVYRQKDFNRAFGVTMVVVGVLLSFFTYGISLLVVTIIDWIIYRSVGEVGICYQCEAHYRKTDLVFSLPPFNLSLFDFYKNLKNNPGLQREELPIIH